MTTFLERPSLPIPINFGFVTGGVLLQYLLSDIHTYIVRPVLHPIMFAADKKDGSPRVIMYNVNITML